MSRADEIAQGLREESGALTFPLDVMEYQRGFVDFTEGQPPPKFTSPSYDLGRALGQRRQEEAQATKDALARIEAQAKESRARVRQMVADAGRFDVLAEFDAKMAELDGGKS